jgi:SnoaL-like domain
VSDCEERLRAIEDRFSIVDLLCRYAVSIDRHRWDDFASCLADEVHADLIRTDGWVRFEQFHQQVGYYEYHLVRDRGWRSAKIRQLEHWQRGNQQIFDRTVR